MADISSVSESIGRYVQWANAALSDKQVAGVKAGSTGGPESIGNCSTGIARLFHRTSISKSRQAAVDGFKTALTGTVGKTLADLVWQSVGGKNAKGLTAGLVKDAVRLTNQFLERTGTNLVPPKGAGVRLAQMTSAQVKGAVTANILTDPDTCDKYFNLVVKFNSMNRLYGMMPASKSECVRLGQLMVKVSAEIHSLVRSFSKEQIAAGEKNAAFSKYLEVALQQFDEKSRWFDALANEIKSGQNVEAKLADHWTKTVDEACGKLVRGASPEMKGVMEEAVAEFKKGISGTDTMLSRVKHEKKDLGKHLQKELGKCVTARFSGKDLKTAKSAVSGLVARCHLDILNGRDWKPIEKTFTASVGNEAFTLKSNIRSGVHIDRGLNLGYDEGVNAYNCHDLAAQHAVNLGTTELQVSDPKTGEDRTIFSGVRHGVHNAQGVDDPAKTNATRAKETVMAAFVNYLKAHPNADPRAPITLNMTSVSLLTPVFDEGKMLKAQNAAWDEVNKKEMSITVGGKTYTVTPNILRFSYGVNGGAVGPVSHLTGGWITSDRLNKANWEGLFGQVNRFTNDKTIDSKIRSAVGVLAGQIESVAKRKGERVARGDIYKMPSRIAVLSYLMGGVPVWNCKSGKDRSGWMDVECKFLATLIDRGMSIPAPNDKLTDEQQQLLHTIMLESGNLELQEYNTGASGYKLKNKGAFNVSSLYRRVGAAKDEVSFIKGGSGYVGS